MAKDILLTIGSFLVNEKLETYFLCKEGSSQIEYVMFTNKQCNLMFGAWDDNCNGNEWVYLGHLRYELPNKISLVFYLGHRKSSFTELDLNTLLSYGLEIRNNTLAMLNACPEAPNEIIAPEQLIKALIQFAKSNNCNVTKYSDYIKSGKD